MALIKQEPIDISENEEYYDDDVLPVVVKQEQNVNNILQQYKTGGLQVNNIILKYISRPHTIDFQSQQRQQLKEKHTIRHRKCNDFIRKKHNVVEEEEVEEEEDDEEEEEEEDVDEEEEEEEQEQEEGEGDKEGTNNPQDDDIEMVETFADADGAQQNNNQVQLLPAPLENQNIEGNSSRNERQLNSNDDIDPLFCEICDQFLKTKATLKMHFKSQKHNKLLKEQQQQNQTIEDDQ